MTIDAYEQREGISRSARGALIRQEGAEAHDLAVMQRDELAANAPYNMCIGKIDYVVFPTLGGLGGIIAGVVAWNAISHASIPFSRGYWIGIFVLLGALIMAGVVIFDQYRQRQYRRQLDALDAIALPYSKYLPAQVYDVSFSRFSDRGADLRLLVYKLSGDTYYPYIIEERHFHYDQQQEAIAYAAALRKCKEELEATQPTIRYHQHDTVSNEISQQLASPQKTLPAEQTISHAQLSLPIGS